MGGCRVIVSLSLALSACAVTQGFAPMGHRSATSQMAAGGIPAEPFYPAGEWGRSLEVTASAYNSIPAQTDSRPCEAAWGDSLYPGLRAIAVSRDLIPMGLGKGATVRIEGLPGEFIVLDKMHSRWRKHIDVYFGVDEKAAREWGRQEVVIRWREAGAQLLSVSAPLRSVLNPRTPS